MFLRLLFFKVRALKLCLPYKVTMDCQNVLYHLTGLTLN